jgi:hypothetical protein
MGHGASNSEPQPPKTIFHSPSIRDFEDWLREYNPEAIVGVEFKGFGERQEERKSGRDL